MLNKELHKQYKKIESLISKSIAASGDDLSLLGEWGKYLCVLSAGFIENGLNIIYLSYIEKSANPKVSKFASSRLMKLQNPKSNRFIEIAQTFSDDWGEELKIFFEENEDVSGAINSIMSTRHLIAHGKNTSITIERVKEYLKLSLKLFQKIEHQCKYTEPY